MSSVFHVSSTSWGRKPLDPKWHVLLSTLRQGRVVLLVICYCTVPCLQQCEWTCVALRSPTILLVRPLLLLLQIRHPSGHGCTPRRTNHLSVLVPARYTAATHPAPLTSPTHTLALDSKPLAGPPVASLSGAWV